MTVKELIKHLEKVEEQDQEVVFLTKKESLPIKYIAAGTLNLVDTLFLSYKRQP